MDNGWIKRFKNGSEILGPDDEKDVSWSRTSLEEMNGADLFFHGANVHLDGEGEYHQSDHYVVLLRDNGVSQAERIYRMVQIKLDTGKWLTVSIDSQGGFMITLEDNKI